MPRLVVEGHQNRKSAPYCDPIQKNPKRCKNPTATVSGASIGVVSLVARIERKRNPGSSRVSLPLNAGYRGRSKLAQQATVTADSIMDAGKPKHIPNARLRCCHHRHVELLSFLPRTRRIILTPRHWVEAHENTLMKTRP